MWSSPLPAAAGRPMRYIELMAGCKPHLTGIANNLGLQTRIEYAPSTAFYLRDKAAGTPWLSRLPFPVHVVERVTTFDQVSRNQFVSRRGCGLVADRSALGLLGGLRSGG
ncbi:MULTISPECIES: toxin TcdB middle/N-terminal domain-containing protein [unclassified Streptomyces]|uniref:toxin TcdB middle/N-terminal domain-containing protein n=1 Tax=unclassified Streptomyces TaxID=2593676 RepID=UPI0038100756